jgi:hypothetical protein
VHACAAAAIAGILGSIRVSTTETSRRSRRRLHRYGLLLAAVFACVAVQGILPPSDAQQVAVAALVAGTLLLAFWAAELSPRLLAFASGLALAALAASIVRATLGGIGDGAVRSVNALLVALGPPAVALGVVRNLRGSREVGLPAVMGVLSLYMLLGMFFAFVYGAIDRLGDPFFAGGAEATVARCLYFSFTTLTTVGYGDFTARTDLGHTLAVFEALIGQIYLVTVVSLIVSNIGRRAVSTRTPD